MLIKTILVFLLAMAAVGMIGNALTKGGVTRSAKKRLGLTPGHSMRALRALSDRQGGL